MMQGPDAHHPGNKRLRTDGGAIVSYQETVLPPLRTSSLPSPTLQLTGHKGSVYGLSYSPNGRTLCSASFDKTCLLWNHSSASSVSASMDDPNDVDDEAHVLLDDDHLQPYENYNVLAGHKNAVLDCHWCDNDTVVTASADQTVQLFDALTARRLRKWEEHGGIVNAVAVLNDMMVVSASDDGTCLVWDRRQKRSAGSLVVPDTEMMNMALPITAVAAANSSSTNKSATDNQYVYTAGLDNTITCWDVRQQGRRVYAMKGHTDTITCLAVHPAGTHLLSNSMDGTLRMWDIRPFVATTTGTTTANRFVKHFVGHKHNAEKGLLKCSWSPRDGSMVTAGSADKMVHIWDEHSTQELYLLPGHKGCVNTVVFHPVESNVIASGSSDKLIFVGELS